MQLRDYQERAHTAVFDLYSKGSDRTLVVMPTGCGKTVLFGTVAHSWTSGRVLVIAHREELIWQAANKIQAITGDRPDIEMADLRASREGLFTHSNVVVASVQTLVSGRACEDCEGQGSILGVPCGRCRKGKLSRMMRFDPQDFGLLIIDESHHGTASSYREIIDYFRQNEALKILGVTATPDRADKSALGQIFDTVAFEYDLPTAIHDGWLVPIRQQWITVDGLDFSKVRTTRGDLNEKELGEILGAEETIHAIVNPTMQIAGDKATLLFAVSVSQAQKMAEVINRHKPGSAICIHGETPKEIRRDLLRRYSAGEYQYLCGCGVFLEGFDEPRVQVVSMARPTKSRALYTQAVGRGTRPIRPPMEQTPEARRAGIASSEKPEVLVLDFVGNSGRHKLVSTADILGGYFDEELVERAVKKAKEGSGSVDMLEEMQALREEDARKKQEEERRRLERLKHVVASNVNFSTRDVSPFDAFDIAPRRSQYNAKPPSVKQLKALWRMGVNTQGICSTEAGRILAEARKREQAGMCNFRQARVLAKHGYPTDVSAERAAQMIQEINQAISHRPRREFSTIQR